VKFPRLLCLALLPAIAACRGHERPAPVESVRVSVPHEVLELDPHARNQLSAFSIVSQIFEPLVTTDATMQIQPCLASRWENPDPSTWVFHLRDGVRFHGGRLLDASDVVYSIDRLLTTPGLELTGYLPFLESAAALDPRTVRIRTTMPLAVLLNKLRFISIVPKGSTRSSLNAHADGTGAYRLAAWTPGKLLTVVRNDAYWGARPPLREVTFRLDRSPEQALGDLISGRSDLIQSNSRKLSTALKGADGYEVFRRTSIFVKYIGYDLGNDAPAGVSPLPNPFRNLLVRQAMNVAIDRRALVESLPYEANPATQLVPPFIFGFNPRIPPPAHDPGLARRLLAQAGFSEGIRAHFLTRKLFGDAARMVASQLRPVGIDLEVEALPDHEFFAIANAGRSVVHLSRFGCLTGDISDILDNVLHSLDPPRHFGIHNFVGYRNAEVDRDIEASAAMQGVNARRDALQRVEKRLMDDLVWIPLYVDDDDYAVDRRFVWHPRNDGLILASEIAPKN